MYIELQCAVCQLPLVAEPDKESGVWLVGLCQICAAERYDDGYENGLVANREEGAEPESEAADEG